MDVMLSVTTPLNIKKIAILGAGVMGAQIAAHCINAGIETLLFDLEATEGKPSARVDQAIASLAKLKPTPLGVPQMALQLQSCNYAQDLASLTECDLIIEAIAERLDWKEALYVRIVPYLSPTAILVSNTSGLSINALASVLPEPLQTRFCGVHFFNPPRYMHLAELIPTQATPLQLLDQLETWLTRFLGKGVVRAKDTPNFIANRIGVFSLLATCHHAHAFQLGLDEVDALTGTLLGRPKSATFRTMDVVGLDTLAHVVQTFQDHLSSDPWHPAFVLPDWLSSLIKKGHLGQKSGIGVYRKQGRVIEVYDVTLGEYRIANKTVNPRVLAILKHKDPKERMHQLMASDDPQARFLVACFRDLFHYCAVHLQDIAHTVCDVDLAMRWGFGWDQGPFETWQAFGVSEMRAFIDDARRDHLTMSSAALPAWLYSLNEFYSDKGAYSPELASAITRHTLPVYRRQLFPDRVMGGLFPSFPILFENEGVCLELIDDGIAAVHFKSKANTIGHSVIDGLSESLMIAQQRCHGLIIHQKDATNFSSGADLQSVLALIKAGNMASLEQMLHEFQQLMMRIKYSSLAVVAALRGRALGGGCELMMQCDGVMAAFESYPGLVEVGVGLIPAGGGCKELAMRAARQTHSNNLMTLIQPYFEQMAMATVASSAPDALRLGYLQSRDAWVMHPNEVLYAAVAKLNAMEAANYLPPLPSQFSVAGREGHACLQVGLVNWLEGGFISPYDYFLANQLAFVLCGGDVNQGTQVDEAWMLRLEREAFLTLAAHPLTQARISHLLETGKPLRN